MAARIYITYSELTGEQPTESELTEIISSLRQRPTFLMLCLLNLVLSLFDHGTDREVAQSHDDIKDYLLDDYLLNLLKLKFSQGSAVSRPIFHRQQLLVMMKRVLLESPIEDGDDPFESQEARYRLGKACVLMNDFLVDAGQNERLLAEQEHDRVLDELLAQWLPTTELNNPPDEGHAIVRNMEYFSVLEQQFSEVTFSSGETLSQLFLRTNKITLQSYLTLMHGVFALYYIKKYPELMKNLESLKIRKSTIFSKMKVSEQEVSSFFHMNARDLSGLKEELQRSTTGQPLKPQYDFTAFRKYPLVFFNEDQLICLDFHLLGEKLGQGTYHGISNSLKSFEDRTLFWTYWGKAFEAYVNRLIGQVYPPLSGRFYALSYFDKSRSEYEAFDGAIDCGDSLIVMEYKGGFLNATAKYAGDPDTLLEDLEKKFGRKPKAGVEQLGRKLELVFNADPKLRKTFSLLNVSNIRKVYPVLVVQDLSLRIGLANWKLRQWLEQELSDRRIDSEVRIRPLSLLTIENLEMVLPHVDAGDFAFTEILDEYSAEYVKGRYEPHVVFQDVLMSLCNKKGIKRRMNDWISKQRKSIIDSLQFYE